MSQTTPSPFSPEVQAAVVSHMNGDHAYDNLLIVKALGGIDDATAATMTGYDEEGARFDATVDGEVVPVVVPWAVPIEDRGTIRVEVVRMYCEACEALGVTPRGEGDH
jgi:glyoxylase-like metal-dependent hydrolase (beta-lactamase superfamily II)